MEKNKEGEKDIVLKALVHCEGCSEKVARCLRGFDGVEQVAVDRANGRVIVKGETADPLKVLGRLRNKYSSNVELISVSPKHKKEKLEEQLLPPPTNTLILKMYIHCQGCANDIQKSIRKMKGVVSVELNVEKSQVTVRGAVEGEHVIQYVKKRLGKHADIINQQQQPNKTTKPHQKLSQQIIMFTYPPQYSTQYLYPNQTFSDENVYSCSIM